MVSEQRRELAVFQEGLILITGLSNTLSKMLLMIVVMHNMYNKKIFLSK